MYVAAMCPRFGNPWKKGKAFFQEYVLRNTRYYEIPVSLLRVLLNNRVLVGATYHATHNTNLVQQSYSYIYRSERFGGSRYYRREQLPTDCDVTSRQFLRCMSLGAQVAAFAYLALATRKHMSTTALVHTVFCIKTAPEPAAAGEIEPATQPQ